MKELTTDILYHTNFFIGMFNNCLYAEGYSHKLNNEFITISTPIIKVYCILRTEYELKKFDFPWIPRYIIVSQSGNTYSVVSLIDDSILVAFKPLVSYLNFSDYLCELLQNNGV